MSIGEYTIEQKGWICQRCGKFTMRSRPKGCNGGLEHIFSLGKKQLGIVPKTKIKQVLALLQ
jgi:hypothetical protein